MASFLNRLGKRSFVVGLLIVFGYVVSNMAYNFTGDAFPPELTAFWAKMLTIAVAVSVIAKFGAVLAQSKQKDQNA
jgi:hypothetical protein